MIGFERQACCGGWVGTVGVIAAIFVAWLLVQADLRAHRLEDGRVNHQISLISTLQKDSKVTEFDDPKRFTSSKRVGAHFGLTPKKYQSGETDVSGRISKMGDGQASAIWRKMRRSRSLLAVLAQAKQSSAFS